MKDLNMEDLKQLLLDGRRALKYAWDHYEELAAREAVYTLYGPYDHGIGAATPGKIIPKASRVLTLKTRKKSYMTYELDGEYNLIRVNYVLNSKRDGTYHCFELNGIRYACHFRYNQKEISRRDEVLAVGYKNGKPYYYGTLGEHFVLANFYEYVSPEIMHVIGYSYHPVSGYSLRGYPIDPEAPLGELNSPAQRYCWDEKPMYTDFSKYFRETETEEQKKEESANTKISDWIDNILNTDIPDGVVAFCFNLYEEGNGSWSMELIGSSRFDIEDSDWPCDEITDFASRKNPYEWEMNCSWKKALAYVTNELKEYLSDGKYANLLKSRKGVGVGFVDGDIKILAK